MQMTQIKKERKVGKAQVVVEYVVLFIIVAAGVALVFGILDPHQLNFSSKLDTELSKVIDRVRK